MLCTLINVRLVYEVMEACLYGERFPKIAMQELLTESVAESLSLSTGLIVMKDYFEPLTPDIADSYSHE